MKNFHLGDFLLLIFLLSTLFLNYLKFYIGTSLGGFIPSFLSLLLIIVTLLRSNFFIFYNKLDLRFFYIFIYLFVNFTFFVAINYDQILDALTRYRYIIHALSIFLYLRLELNINENALFKTRKIIQIYFIFLSLNLLIETFMFNFLKISLQSMPWVVYFNSLETQLSEIGSRFGNLEHNNYRIPTFFGTPHYAGLLSASLSFVWLFFYQKFKLKQDIFCFFISIFGVIIADSKLQILILLVMIFLLLKKLRYKIFAIIIFIALMLSIGEIYYINHFYNSIALSSELEFKLFLTAIVNEFNISEFFDLIPINDFEWFHPLNLLIYLFGVGFGDSSVYGTLYDIAKIESGIWLDLIPKYGLIFLVIYLNSLFSICKISFKYKLRILWLGLLPFYFSFFHYWLALNIGVVEIFAVMYSLLISEIDSKIKMHSKN